MAAGRLAGILKSVRPVFCPEKWNTRAVNSLVSEHTDKWLQDATRKSPMELINEVPPIKVEGRIVACEGDSNPALGHPIEFICLDLKEPAICKYCGLRYIQDHHHH
ncbi:NADH dehydrogenase [ubiquinone] iron-sulfur protein 6, mitochondrial [Apostasia shenzhenica]|uniref:NADH dehydrogenase [ubiquinone] iron-sulfur protein 6, mitochondrial n=1 Tax=Apostasia shenzhenica TaxID=1088818 RepID=A0A2I0ACF7_9ASPA|nr:NADH dehydrogenase [ubiquinone] iron-sulfur protein 6, mitochondrial [Apostasia shenzhenica]